MDEAARRIEIENLYRLALGRKPEPGADTSGFMVGSLSDVASIFFRSTEFRTRVAEAFARRSEPVEAEFDYPPATDLIQWAVQSFGLPLESAATVRSWAQLYRALFHDETTVGVLGSAERPFDEWAWRAVLDQAAEDDQERVIGAVDAVSADRVTGWAVDLVEPGRSVRLELWIDGAFASAGETDQFRRDIEERFPDVSRPGFNLAIPDAFLDRADQLSLEVRQAGRSRVLGCGELSSPGASQADAYEGVRRELATIRETLARLEQSLPTIEHQLTHRLDDWTGYFDAWYRPTHEAIRAAQPPVGEGRIRIRIDAASAPALWVEEAVASALEQSRPCAGISVAGLDDQGRLQLEDLLSRRQWRGEKGAVIEAGEPDPGAGPVLAFSAAGVLSPDAIETVEAFCAAHPGFTVAYVDEDRLAAEADSIGDWRERAHVAPALKPAFDLDLARQAPWLGDCLFFAGDFQPGGPEAVLRAAEAGGEIVSIPRVLFSRRIEAVGGTPDWAGVVSGHLSRMGEAVTVEPLNDCLGAAVAEAVRLRPVAPEGATATVIIPTRDRLDLLRPCLNSIAQHAAANRGRFDVLVIDHDSQEAGTAAFLAERKAAGEIDVLTFRGEFNWALINNHAADRATGDVLIFLNNDTVVISPDWLDALVAQALRPDVGAVGARLVYQDGTLQHAGFVARPRDTAFLIHEGVGIPGSDGGHLGRHALRHRTVAVTGACMAVQASVFKRLGGFDAAALPVEGNDVDYCLRAQAEGLAVIYEPAATLYHLESKSRGLSQDGERLRQSALATRRVWSRWGERFRDDPAFNPHFARDGRPFDRLRPPQPVKA